MKLLLASLGASALMACGDQPGADAWLYIDPPKGDNSCVGVAGFDVTILPTGQTAQTTKLVGSAPILDAQACAIPGQFSVGDLDIDRAVTVSVKGYDGTGPASAARLSATATIKNLRDAPVHVELEASKPPPPPVLVIHRNAHLQGVPLAEVTDMVISTQRQPMPLLRVERAKAGVYFDTEPGAYGIPNNGLDAGGADEGLVLTVNFTAKERVIKDLRVTIHWNGRYYEAMQ